MPRYFFHIEDHKRFPDEEGTELAGLAEARVEAVRVAGAMLSDNASTFWDSGSWRVVVTDEGRHVLFAVSFSATDAASLPQTYDPLRSAD
jgi:hypothetical protein